MNAIKVARRFIETDPANESAKILAQLVLALESERSFELVTLYNLDYKSFELAMDILKEWRLDRYYASKSKLFDLSLQVTELEKRSSDACASDQHPARHLDALGSGASPRSHRRWCSSLFAAIRRFLTSPSAAPADRAASPSRSGPRASRGASPAADAAAPRKRSRRPPS
jgi:hypothetical protein